MYRSRLTSALVLAFCIPAVLASQDREWLPGDAIPLVRAATAERGVRDSSLAGARWRATARGLIRFASVVDHRGGGVERVIRADELHVEVYGGGPSGGKQVIRSWRDTSFQINDIIYHRDHLGIVTNDFGDVLRLGDGDEVRDVPHPLTPAGMMHYLFREGDTVTIATSGRPVRVAAVEVRPVDGNGSGAVGVMHIDLDRGALVVFRFTFTRSSYRDRTVADITVELQNSLLEGRQWAPWRQSIAIRRESPVLSLPIHTVLRADWEIDDYRFDDDAGPGLPATAPSIGGLRRPGGDADWDGPLADRLALVPATEADRDELRVVAEDFVGRAMLDGMPPIRFLQGGIGNWFGANRVQGVRLGGAATARIGLGLEVAAGIGLATSDGLVTGDLSLGSRNSRVGWWVSADRTVVDAADEFPGSVIANSLATLTGGLDAGDWYLRERLMLRGEWYSGRTVVGGSVAREATASLAGSYGGLFGDRPRPNPALGYGEAVVLAGSVANLAPTGDGWRLQVERGTGDSTWIRWTGAARARMPLGLDGRVRAELGSDGTPPARWARIGGRNTLTGVPHRSMVGRRSLVIEIARPIAATVPAPPVGGLHRLPLRSFVTPFAALGVVGGTDSSVPAGGRGSVQPVIGVRFDLWGPLVRLEAGWAVRRGRFGVTFDAHPDWWPIL